jgi:hypothetical protein
LNQRKALLNPNHFFLDGSNPKALVIFQDLCLVRWDELLKHKVPQLVHAHDLNVYVHHLFHVCDLDHELLSNKNQQHSFFRFRVIQNLLRKTNPQLVVILNLA